MSVRPPSGSPPRRTREACSELLRDGYCLRTSLLTATRQPLHRIGAQSLFMSESEGEESDVALKPRTTDSNKQTPRKLEHSKASTKLERFTTPTGAAAGRLIDEPGESCRIFQQRAVSAAVEMVVFVDPVADYPRSACLARRGEGIYRALEGVKGMSTRVHYDLESPVVVVVTNLALTHNVLLAARRPMDSWSA